MANIVPRKTFVIPAVISAIFPGFGQVFKLQFVKAFLIWGAGFVLWLLFGWWTAIPGGLLYLANILDALLSTDEEKLFK